MISLALLSSGNLNSQTLELSSTGELLDGIAAVVNDGVVLKSELQLEVQRIAARLQAQGVRFSGWTGEFS